MGATAHQLVAVIELCKLVAADPGASVASGRHPCCRGFGAWRWSRDGWTRGAAEASIPSAVHFCGFLFFLTGLGFYPVRFLVPYLGCVAQCRLGG
jgi:hypothetical protein